MNVSSQHLKYAEIIIPILNSHLFCEFQVTVDSFDAYWVFRIWISSRY